jgi:hypothetical protein
MIRARGPDVRARAGTTAVAQRTSPALAGAAHVDGRPLATNRGTREPEGLRRRRTEDDIEETPDRRIVRRGDEEFIVTMDLRPGRQNLELDDDGTGTHVVTRIVGETPEGGDDNLVIE